MEILKNEKCQKNFIISKREVSSVWICKDFEF